MQSDKVYQVGQTDAQGNFICAISGLGNNAGRWDKLHSKRTAQHYARQMRKENPQKFYRVEHYLGAKHNE